MHWIKATHTDRLDGSPSRVPAQQESPSGKGAPPMVTTNVPPRSYTSTRAKVAVTWATARNVEEAATAMGLSMPTRTTYKYRCNTAPG